MVAVWASRFLPPLSADLPQVEVAEGVVSTETLAGTFQLKVRSGEHTLFADEPASVGGLGTGLSPYELVSAGLAACTVMTMRLYANRKGFPLERASTTVQHEKVPDMSANAPKMFRSRGPSIATSICARSIDSKPYRGPLPPRGLWKMSCFRRVSEDFD